MVYPPEACEFRISSTAFPWKVLKNRKLPDGPPSGAVSRLLGVAALATFGVMWLRSVLIALLRACCGIVMISSFR